MIRRAGRVRARASSTTRARTLVATLVVLALGLAAAGCSEVRPTTAPPLGQVERTGSIKALDLVLVTNGKGVARLVGTLVNEAEEPDRLVGIDLAAEPPGGYSVFLA